MPADPIRLRMSFEAEHEGFAAERSAGFEQPYRQIAAANARHVHSVRPVVYGGWHLLGTARMGNDPERSVVNSWGRSHDVKNLFIVDGSIFVTSGGVNPTCTIQALARAGEGVAIVPRLTVDPDDAGVEIHPLPGPPYNFT